LGSTSGNEPGKQRFVLYHARPWWAIAPVVACLALAIFGLLMWRENKELKESIAKEERTGIQAQAQLAHDGDRGADRAYIQQAESDWAESVTSGDCTVPERILADDFVGVDTDGKHYTKAAALRQCRSHDSNFASNHLKAVEVRFYGEMAVAQGSEEWKLKTGKPGIFVWTDTWLKHAGKWQIMAAEDLIPVPSPFANSPLKKK